MTRFHVLPHPLSVLVVTGLALAGLVLPPSPVAAAPADPASVSPVASGPAQDGSTASPTGAPDGTGRAALSIPGPAQALPPAVAEGQQGYLRTLQPGDAEAVPGWKARSVASESVTVGYTYQGEDGSTDGKIYAWSDLDKDGQGVAPGSTSHDATQPEPDSASQDASTQPAPDGADQATQDATTQATQDGAAQDAATQVAPHGATQATQPSPDEPGQDEGAGQEVTGRGRTPGSVLEDGKGYLVSPNGSAVVRPTGSATTWAFTKPGTYTLHVTPKGQGDKAASRETVDYTVTVGDAVGQGGGAQPGSGAGPEAQPGPVGQPAPAEQPGPATEKPETSPGVQPASPLDGSALNGQKPAPEQQETTSSAQTPTDGASASDTRPTNPASPQGSQQSTSSNGVGGSAPGGTGNGTASRPGTAVTPGPGRSSGTTPGSGRSATTPPETCLATTVTREATAEEAKRLGISPKTTAPAPAPVANTAVTTLTFKVGDGAPAAGGVDKGGFDLGPVVENGTVLARVRNDDDKWVDPSSMTFALGGAARTKAPGDVSSVAAEGSTVWAISSRGGVGSLSLGLSARHKNLVSGTTGGVEFTLLSVSGPDKGKVGVYSPGFLGGAVARDKDGKPVLFFDKEGSGYTLPHEARGLQNWMFTEPGTYKLTIAMKVTPVSGELTGSVGGATSASPAPTGPGGATSPATPGPAAPTSPAPGGSGGSSPAPSGPAAPTSPAAPGSTAPGGASTASPGGVRSVAGGGSPAGVNAVGAATGPDPSSGSSAGSTRPGSSGSPGASNPNSARPTGAPTNPTGAPVGPTPTSSSSSSTPRSSGSTATLVPTGETGPNGLPMVKEIVGRTPSGKPCTPGSLARTGASPLVPLTLAGVLALVGTAAVVTRRRALARYVSARR